MEDKNKGSAINMQILTPSGFQPFDGVVRYWHDKSLKFIFEDGSIESAYDHRFIVNSKEVFARDVKIGDNIGKTVKKIIQISEGDYFYDPINVSNGKIYSHDNGLVSHNTFFGSGDTLISAETLMSLRAREPKRKLEDYQLKVFVEPNKSHEYIMCVDVAKGRGQDYSTFTIIDISREPFEQVCTYRCNTISPILFPTIIYKYATIFNNAYIIVEANDQGGVVTNALYYDFEYENLHTTSSIKADSLGIEMNRKVKRIGCSAIKDILENDKLIIYDENTISECTTFVSKGQSFSASDGNHDDLIMNLVMFGYFVSTEMFRDLTDISIKKMLYDEKIREIENDVPIFGFIDDGSERIRQIENQENLESREWSIEYETDF